MSCGCAPLRGHWQLLALAMGLPLVEALAVGAVGTPAAQALAPQVTAPAPFGVFHDLRWLLVFHSSWLAFALELVALVVVRSTITALLVRAAWPVGIDRPGLRRLLGGSVAFTLVSALVLAPFAALLVGMAVVSLSWLFFVAVPAVLGVAALVHHGAVVPSWWRERPPDRTVGWVLLTFLVLTLASASVVLAPAPWRLLAVAATGLFNAWAWHTIVHTLCCGERSRRVLPIAPLGVGALVTAIVVGASAGFSVATRQHTIDQATPRSEVEDGRPVLLVSGFGSSYDGRAGDLGGPERRFSYGGSDPGGRPLPYTGVDTYQDLSRSVALMAEQVDAFHTAASKPITIVAESEGALVAKAYLMSHPGAPVDALVLLSPLVEPGLAYYPPSGEDGWGVAGGWSLRWVSSFVRALSPFDVSTDEGLFRSLVDDAPALRGMLACPVDGVRQLVLFPLADAVVSPELHLDGVPNAVVPAFHGGLASNAHVQRTIRAMLDGRAPSRVGWLEAADTMIRAGATGWRVPTLPISVNPRWEAADDVSSCPEIAGLVAHGGLSERK